MRKLTIEEMKEVNAGKDCAAGYMCVASVCWYKWVAPDGDVIWLTDWSSCG
jgi:hypothetical protein